MLDAYIYEGLRTPFGRHAGALAKVRPDDLLDFHLLLQGESWFEDLAAEVRRSLNR